jgi:alpha-tubulin suppressor-like RCC1 family protein
MQRNRHTATARPLFVRVLLTLAVASASLSLSVAGARSGPTTTTVSGPEGKPVYSEKVTFTATVKGGAPTGKVTFRDGKKKFGSATLSRLPALDSLSSSLGYHSCALTAAGGVVCWGNNNDLQLGPPTGGTSDTPVAVQGLSSGITVVGTGFQHSCAVTHGGTLKCWGDNDHGELGIGAISSHSSGPVNVTGLASGVTAVDGGYRYTCAVANGGARCWGSNGSGQLGDGTNVQRLVPVPVAGLGSGVTDIDAGEGLTCAVANGAAKCWGNNNVGQLGIPTSTASSNTPVAVTGLSSGIAAIGVGYEHSCALTSAGGVKCWGSNSNGQLGNGTTVDSSTPVNVSGLSSGVVALAVGESHNCAITAARAAKCWGANFFGQLGNGNTTFSPIPVNVIGLSDVAAVGPAYDHTCAITGNGAIKCWGRNASGQLGNGTEPTDSLVPVDVTGFGPQTAMAPGEAALSTKKLNAGKRKIMARYKGDSANTGSASPALKHKVKKAKTRTEIKAKPKSPKAGGSARLKIEIKARKPATGKPKGKAIVKDGNTSLGKFKVKKGKAGVNTSFATTGQHNIKALYRGDRNWKKSGGKTKVNVRN